MVGRPSNTGGVQYLAKLLATDTTRKVIVMGERDRKENGLYPGAEGAERVAGQLTKRLRQNKVSWKMPPDGAKDLRTWLNTQLTSLGVEDEILAKGLGARVFG